MSDLWTTKWPEKRAIYGDTNMVPVGGPTPQSDELEVKDVGPRTKDSVEPVFYHSLPESFYIELLKAFPIAAVLDLTVDVHEELALPVPQEVRGHVQHQH